MNARQVKKQLKKQINKLKSDNNVMRRIIEDNICMKETYNMFNKPLKITHTNMQVEKFTVIRQIHFYMKDGNSIEWTKEALANDLFYKIRENITYYELDNEGMNKSIMASIYVGRK